MKKRTNITLDPDVKVFLAAEAEKERERLGYGPKQNLPLGQMVSGFVRQSREYREWRKA